MKHHSPHYYSFQNHPFWVDENNKIYTDEFFLDKNYEDYYFDNFLDMDAVFGHEDSLFGTKGLPVGHPERSSKSFDMYTKNYGTAIVRVLKTNSLQEQILRIKEVMGVVKEGLHDTSWENEKGDKITLIDLLNVTEEIPVQEISVEELKPYLLSWYDYQPKY